jgi:hypothetical protein
MSDLEGLVGKSQTKEIDGVSITLKPLTLEDFDIIMMAASDNAEENMKGMRELVKRTLEKSYPDDENPMATIGMAHINDLLPFVVEVNGLAPPEELEKALKGRPLEGSGESPKTS